MPLRLVHRLAVCGMVFAALYLPAHQDLVRLGVQPSLQRGSVDMSDSKSMQRHIALQEFVKRLRLADKLFEVAMTTQPARK